MKKLLFLIAMLFVAVGCSVDEQSDIIQENIKIQTSDSLEMRQNPIAEMPDGTLVYANDPRNKELFKDVSDFIYVEPSLNISREQAERKNGNGNGNGNNGNGGGKKVRAVKLSPATGEPQLATMAITNIMRDPVAIPDTYAQPLPEPIGQFALVDWDGDGTLDEFEIHGRCYFPRSFAWVTVNGVMINNSIAYGAQILGFDDVDGDGDLDVLLQGGNHRMFNAIDGVNNGSQNGEVTEPYSAYNVGYNEVDETPDPLATMIESLVVVQDVNNPEFVRWDLGNFLPNADGELISQYEAYVFHVYWRPVDPVTLEFIPTEVGYQTTTYGEWGIGASHLPTSGTVAIRFTNADDTVDPLDECVDKWIYVTY